MAILIKLATCHVCNAFKRPLRPNAPTARVLTSVILKGNGWAFRKSYPTKIPGMVHQGLLAPQRLRGLHEFTKEHSNICCVIATNAFGLGVDFRCYLKLERRLDCPINQIIDMYMYHSTLPSGNQHSIKLEFTKEHSNIRCVIATNAFSLGVTVRDKSKFPLGPQ